MSDKVGNITFGPDTPGPKMDKYEKMVIHTGSTVTKRLIEQRDALVRALEGLGSCWSDFTSQEMYGEMLREGMESVDFYRWEAEHDAARALLAEIEKEGR